MLPLTVIICTYNRAEAVGKTLALLLGPEVEVSRCVDLSVIVVDQGHSLQRESYPDDWKLRIVHQDNFGGAGGFARGMIEAMDEGAGWLLLMDDDATPDIESFPILAEYIRSRAPETRFALHGAMFSSEEPDTIYEAGATIKEPKSRNFDIVQRLRGYKPATPIQEDPKLWESMDIDYGAWWCFCIHSETISEVGLPLPLFVRGDDAEYGLRLKTAGIQTIPLPGLRIWHPAHSDRLDLWYYFFDWRNKFITKALHGPGSPRLWITTFVRLAFYKLLAAQYELVEIMIAGLVAFLRGPDTLLDSPHDLLRSVRRHDTPGHILKPSAARRTLAFLPKVTKSRLWRNVWQTATLNGLVFSSKYWEAQPLPAFYANNFDWLATYRLKAYAIVSRSTGEMRIHRRSLWRFLLLLMQLIISAISYLLRTHAVAAKYRNEAAYLSSRLLWQEGLPKKRRLEFKPPPHFNHKLSPSRQSA